MDDRKEWTTEYTKQLFQGVLSLKNQDECEKFFRDLLTSQEIETYAARLESASLLQKGISYREIAKRTGMSTATITRVNQWLERGLGGYKLVLSRITKSHLHKTANNAVL